MTLERKLKEAVLALRLERTFNKRQLLELYLNEIYLGLGSYGVAAAALNYFDKPLSELSLEEAAYLAALPRHPTTTTRSANAPARWHGEIGFWVAWPQTGSYPIMKNACARAGSCRD